MTDAPEDHVCGEHGIYWHGCEQCLVVNLSRSPRKVTASFLRRYAGDHGLPAAQRLGEAIRNARENDRAPVSPA